MNNFNIVYDERYWDADIISVPDAFSDKMDSITKAFLQWVYHTPDKEYWTIIDGIKVFIIETEGFVKWINRNYCLADNQVRIVAANREADPKLNCIHF